MNFDLRLLRNMDYWLLLVVVALSVAGIFVVASATRGLGPPALNDRVIRQIAGVIIGLAAMVVALMFDYTEFARMYRFLYYFNVLLLLAVLIPGVGLVVNGARSWIPLGMVQFQPAELAKVLLILTMGWLLARQERLDAWWEMIPATFHMAPSLALVLAQPDLGTALVLIAMLAVMLYMAGAPGWRFVVMGILAVGGVFGIVYAHVHMGLDIPLPTHQVNRLVCWVYPSYDLQNACYNVNQSMIAIGSGGMWGRGYGQGTQNQLGFIPENHTDFVFALIGEEFGFVGGSVLVLLFVILLYRILHAAVHAKDRYGMLICAGAAAMIAFHVVENIGMTMGVMPVTGIPLPFISYGPTAVVANLTAVGLVLNVYMRRQKIMF